MKWIITFAPTIDRGVAQPGLEYSSGGRGVGSSNLLTPTTLKPNALTNNVLGFFFIEFGPQLARIRICSSDSTLPLPGGEVP